MQGRAESLLRCMEHWAVERLCVLGRAGGVAQLLPGFRPCVWLSSRAPLPCGMPVPLLDAAPKALLWLRCCAMLAVLSLTRAPSALAVQALHWPRRGARCQCPRAPCPCPCARVRRSTLLPAADRPGAPASTCYACCLFAVTRLFLWPPAHCRTLRACCARVPGVRCTRPPVA